MELTPATVLVLFAVAVVAGTVDAIAGGGGLLTLPSLLALGVPPHLALGTNKGQSVVGSLSALWRYARAGLVDRRVAAATFPLGLVGAGLGALAAMQLDPSALRPVVLVLLVVAAVAIVTLRPTVVARPARPVLGMVVVLGLGAYDGFFGPGTGTFLLLCFVLAFRRTVEQATAQAKVVNFASNLGSLLFFAGHGAVLWPVALPMAAGQLVGGLAGASLAVRGGARFIRPVVLLVVAGLLGKLGFDVWRGQ